MMIALGERSLPLLLLLGMAAGLVPPLAAQEVAAPETAEGTTEDPTGPETAGPPVEPAPPRRTDTLLDPTIALVHRLAGKKVPEPSLDDQYQLALSFLEPGFTSPDAEIRQQSRELLEAIALQATRPGAEAELAACRKALAGLLPGREDAVRFQVLRQLERIGADESIPALVSLLADPVPEIDDAARRALHAIGSPAAIEALAKALETNELPFLQIGLLRSLGDLGGAEHLPMIQPLLGTEDADLRTAALRSATDIGGENAVKTLLELLVVGEGEEAKVDPEIAESLLTVGQRALRTGDVGTAKLALQPLDQKGVPASLRRAALAGRIAAAPEGALDQLRSIFEGEDIEQTVAAAGASAALAADSGIVPLLREFSLKTPPRAAAALLRQIVAREFVQALPELRTLAASQQETIAIEALTGLGKLGSEGEIELLLRIAGSESVPIRETARSVLTHIGGEAGDKAISVRAANPSEEPGTRAEAARAIGARGMKGQVDVLLGLLRSGDKEITSAAVEALAGLGDESMIPELALGLADSGRPAFPHLRVVLQRICQGASDPEAASVALLQGSARADTGGQEALLQLLAILGGNTGLAHATATLASEDPEIRAAAMRSLADWSTFAASETLLELFQAETTTPQERVTIATGIARLAKTPGLATPEDRLALALAATGAATEPAEIKQLTSALGALPSLESAGALSKLLTREEVAKEAAAAAIQVAEKLPAANIARRASLLQEALAVQGLPDSLREKAQRLAEGKPKVE